MKLIERCVRAVNVWYLRVESYHFGMTSSTNNISNSSKEPSSAVNETKIASNAIRYRLLSMHLCRDRLLKSFRFVALTYMTHAKIKYILCISFFVVRFWSENRKRIATRLHEYTTYIVEQAIVVAFDMIKVLLWHLVSN